MDQNLEKAILEIVKTNPEFEQVTSMGSILDSRTYMEEGVLHYTSIPHALFYLENYLSGNPITIQDSFTKTGVMLDLSRNQVFTVEYMKEVLRKKALLGINSVMLYIEDIYEVPNHPYLGYMRGKYTASELRSIISYANILGVEVLPSIQTLGHMGQFLRWNENSKYKDNTQVLYASNEDTYQLIEDFVSTIQSIFQTKTIHIGMDETFGMGTGRYLKEKGYQEAYITFVDHLKRVNDLCLKHGFEEVMIWSDMFFRVLNKGDYYYDPNVVFPEKYFTDIPKNVTLVYWDYYNSNKDIVEKMIEKHLELKRKVVFASGTWIWTKLVYDKKKTDSTCKIHIDACKKLGIQELYYTEWNDDGAPCEYTSCYLGTYEMNHYALTGNTEYNNQAFDWAIKEKREDMLYASKLQECPIDVMSLLYDDPLLWIFSKNEALREDHPIEPAIDFLKKYTEEFPKNTNSKLLAHVELLAHTLYRKLKIFDHLEKNYRTHSISCNEDIEYLTMCFNSLYESFRGLWLEKNKPFGLDVIESRLATQIVRTEELSRRIEEYMDGRASHILELEEHPTSHQYIRQNYMNIAYSTIFIHQ